MDSSKILQHVRARVGQQLGERWTLSSLIGVGGMCAVYEGTDASGRRAAIKVLHTIYARDSRVKARFLQEAAAMNRIQHSAVLQIDAQSPLDGGEPWHSMPLLKGQTLTEIQGRCRRYRVPVDVVVPVALTVLDVLDEAHRHGIIHRDIKPENLFITTNEELKVLDFGVARVLDTLYATGTLMGSWVGTPHYMAPEQARGEWQNVDGRTDLWAVGATMFTLLVGRFVHAVDDEHHAVEMAATTTVEPLHPLVPEVPLALTVVIDRALSFAPLDRWTDALTMADALRAAAESAGVATDLAGFRQRLRSRSLPPPDRASLQLELKTLAPAWQGAAGDFLSQAHVLVVEEAPIADELAQAIRELGLTVSTCPTLQDAEHKLAALHLDMAVIGSDLPASPSGRDGPELARLVGETRDIPTVLIMAEISEASASKALRSGAVDYVVKPFVDIAPVARRLEAVLHRRISRLLHDVVLKDLAALASDGGERAVEPRQALAAFRQEMQRGPQVVLMPGLDDEMADIVAAAVDHKIQLIHVAEPELLRDLASPSGGPFAAIIPCETPRLGRVLAELAEIDPFLESVVLADRGQSAEAIRALRQGAAEVCFREEGSVILMSRVQRLMMRGRHRCGYVHLMASLYEAAREVDAELADRLLSVVPNADRRFVSDARATSRMLRVVKDMLQTVPLTTQPMG